MGEEGEEGVVKVGAGDNDSFEGGNVGVVGVEVLEVGEGGSCDVGAE